MGEQGSSQTEEGKGWKVSPSLGHVPHTFTSAVLSIVGQV